MRQQSVLTQGIHSNTMPERDACTSNLCAASGTGAWASLEFSAPGSMKEVEALGHRAGALVSSSREAAAVVRYLGVDG